MGKRKNSKSQDAPNLRRFRSEIQSMTKSNRHYPRPGSKKTRKDRRKEARLEKKSRKNAYFRKLPMPSKEEQEKVQLETIRQQQQELKIKKQENAKLKKKAQKERKKQKEKESRDEQRKIETMWDDKEIRDLEKKLGLNKRKNKDTLPMSFTNDGLDYIFDVLDSEKLKTMSDIVGGTEDDDFGLGGDNSDEDHSDDGDDLDLDHDEDDEDDDDMENEKDDFIDEDGDDDNDEYGEDNTKTVKTKESAIEKKLDNESKRNKLKTESEKSNIETGKKERWEELADRIKELTEKKEKKKSVKFAKNIEEVKILDEDKSDGDNDDYDDDDELPDEDEFDDDDDDEGKEEDYGHYDDDHDDHDHDHDGSYEEEGEKLESDSDITNMQIKRKRDDDLEESELKEDIYGRLRDSEGNIVRDNKPAGGGEGAYVPPAKRLQMAKGDDGKKRLQLERLQKQLKGLINRASENNMQPISGQIEELYLSNSRADVTESLVGLISEACITPVLTPERLSMELMMLVAILHGNVGSEVGAVFLQHFARKFDELTREPEHNTGKQMDNVVVLMAHLYNFKVVHSVLMYDILKILTDSFTERDIEIILLLLRHIGFSLRKDSPSELKDFIVKVQARAGSQDSASLVDQSRVRFMLEIILAIRNNNMRKIPNYDPEHLEHLRKLIRQYIRGSFGDNQLHISLQDLLNADKQGKWWLVGSAWDGKSQQQHSPVGSKGSSMAGKLEVSTKLQELARKQRMNTDLRRSVFFVIMTSEDYLDAFEKLLRLGLKSSQQQEIILVIMDCCLQEKKYNPFYSHLGQKFCEHHRTYQMAFQFCVWDRFKEISNLSDTNRNNLGKLLAHLIINKALSLSILKVISFGTLEKNMVRLLKQLICELLEQPVPEMEAVFTRIAQIDKLKALCEGLRLFMRHFLVGKKSETKSAQLIERVDVADTILSRGKSHVLL